MKIIVISAVFPPEPIVSAKTSYSLAKYLHSKHHQVQVITNFPNRPEGRLYPGYKRTLFKRSTGEEGFSIIRCFTTISKASSLVSRWMENITFGLTSSIAFLTSPKPDVVYLNSWPIFASAFACLACRIKKVPFVLSIQDIYPESLKIQGRLTPHNWVYKFLLSIDRWVSAHAWAILLLSQKFIQEYASTRAIDLHKIHVVPNWVESDSITVMEKSLCREDYNITNEEFVFLYGGNIGRAAGVEDLIRSFKLLEVEKETALLIAGSGTQLSECQNMAKGIGGTKILFHSPWLPEESSMVLAIADVLLLPTQGSQSLVSVPSKLLSYLLAARPILAIVHKDSDIAGLIISAGCGWIVPPGDKEKLLSLIREITHMPPKKLTSMGQAGRSYALQHFTADNLLPKVSAVLENCVEKFAEKGQERTNDH